jgi:hypothetical protein
MVMRSLRSSAVSFQLSAFSLLVLRLTSWVSNKRFSFIALVAAEFDRSGEMS